MSSKKNKDRNSALNSLFLGRATRARFHLEINFDMNLIEIISRNQFLKELYPDGLNDFFIGRIELTSFDRINIFLHCKQQPNISVSKWGIWGEDYNIITIELLGAMISKLNIVDWQKNSEEKCQYIIKESNSNYQIDFFGKEWRFEIELGLLTFQRNSTYIISTD